ncbi:PREDICTED: tyrosine-protein kinase receptor Tie-1-like [Branchiostoma belcheri]|uniref:Tyrosine-protein kinase receptor Tie-1-like n=1 Tax=Branchiostoma belcheri TaxID=7741 RepID=A0A6P4YEL1_BRABE|nr:PREDICTED: tyrosine-protein kinase receptor Tie-1-like [Branchiostoma belcheri]
MAVHHLQTTLVMIVIYLILTRQTTATTEEFRVSVPENVAVGQAIITLPRTQLGDKAELPCAKIMDGDPHFRFNVTKDCIILVANPLDWSVESAYLLNIHRGLYNTSVEVQLTDVVGYPPVYNDTCETPTNPKGGLLLSLKSSAEVLTTNQDVLYIRHLWYDDFFHPPTYDHWKANTNNSDCTFHLATYLSWADDIITFKDIYDNGLRQTTCSAGSDNHDLSAELFFTGGDEESRLQKLRKFLPNFIVDDVRDNIIVLFLKCIFPAKDAKLYSCNFPTFLHPPVRAFNSDARIQIASFEYVDVEVRPIGCPVGRYGFLCNKNCICKNGARCHGFNGACRCAPGWKGVACDIPKPDVSITTTPSDPRQIYTSRNVAFHCRALNIDAKVMSLRFPNGSEKLVSGENYMTVLVANMQPENSGHYICMVLDKDGLTLNATLDVLCPPNRKGVDCDEACDCLQGASCDRWAGCVCPPGWNGTRCQTKCPRGTYGKDCTKRCSCQNGASCSPSGGRCNCTDGWYGNDCGKPCPSGLFGWRCQQRCACKYNATCNSVDGSCTCVTPWTGRYCDQLQTSRARDEPLLESLIPLGSLVLLVAIVTAILFKTGVLACSVPETGEEEKILFELRRMEQDLAQTLQPGWLGRWEKKARHLTPGPLIGEGMFGKVRRAQLRTTGGRLDVAAKAVRVEDAQSYRDFYREAAILVAVHQVQEQDGNDRKSNIVRLVGLITKSAEKYILLEYAPKGDLLGFLRGIKNNNQEYLLENLLGYAVHIARALQELERLRIAHRDVAARNVLITADDVAKLADFGLARDVYATAQYVRANRPGLDELLPLKWMALESIETGEYTCQSDVWSFGVLLWEIATLGQDPCYDGRTQLTFLQMVGILRQGIRMNRPPGCPEDLYRLMRACWRDVPATRPTPEGIEKRLLQLRLALLIPEAIQIMETAL